MKIILYTTGCPKCTVLKKKLDEKHIEYMSICNVELMRELGVEQVPVLDVDGKWYNFKEAVKWLEEYNGN